MENSSAPLVSVVIPTFRRPELLRGAIRSVLVQTYPKLELIIVDDADVLSDLQNEKQLAEARNIPFIQRATGGGAGGGGTRNLGAQQARGEYIAFLDDDDTWLPEKISEQATLLQAHSEVSLVSCDYEIVEQGKAIGIVHLSTNESVDDYKALTMSNVLGSASLVLLRKSDFLKVGGFDEALPSCQDWDLWFRLRLQCGSSRILPKVLVQINADAIPRISSKVMNRVRGLSMFYMKHKQQLPFVVRFFLLARIVEATINESGFGGGWTKAIGHRIRMYVKKRSGYSYKTHWFKK